MAHQFLAACTGNYNCKTGGLICGAFVVFCAHVELVELVAVDEGKGTDILDTVCPDDSSDREIEGHVSAEALLGQDLRHFLLLAESHVDQELFGVQTA